MMLPSGNDAAVALALEFGLALVKNDRKKVEKLKVPPKNSNDLNINKNNNKDNNSNKSTINESQDSSQSNSNS
jgi:hypothetical protein